jgi:hypothetical protein
LAALMSGATESSAFGVGTTTAACSIDAVVFRGRPLGLGFTALVDADGGAGWVASIGVSFGSSMVDGFSAPPWDAILVAKASSISLASSADQAVLGLQDGYRAGL